METHGLYQLNEYIKQVMALNFPDAIWIKAEISQIKSSRGQYYIELVEKDEKTDVIIAQASAVIWYKNYLFISKKLGKLTEAILSDGTEISVKVRIDFHERYGYKLIIEDIDPSYTIGQLELQRQATLEKIEKNGLLEANKSINLPKVLQRVAVISSSTAAGYGDFVNQVQSNVYDYKYQLELFPAAMQGRSMSKEVCSALKEIQARYKEFDCIVIIRGGGSKLDLGGFDDYDVAYNIAFSKLPVLTGIGHQIDISVADMIAHMHFKTPTAVANFLIDRSLDFEAQLTSISNSIKDNIAQRIQHEKLNLEHCAQMLLLLPKDNVKWKTRELEFLKKEIFQHLQYKIKFLKHSFEQKSKMLQSYDPQLILKRGYAMIQKDGAHIDNSKALKKQDKISIIFQDGAKDALIQ